MNEKPASNTKVSSGETANETTPADTSTGIASTTTPQKGTQPATDQAVGPFGIFIGLLFWMVIILAAVWKGSKEVREFLQHWWWAVGAGICLLALILGLVGFRRWFAKAAAEKRTGAVVFVIIPVVLVAIGGVTLLKSDYQITVVRSVFLVAVCLLPALIYYLFIAARKFSLLNDYFVNLARLGLLERRPGPDPETARTECQVKLLNYVQKFEALYGPLPTQVEDAIVEAGDPLAVLADPGWRQLLSSGSVRIFTRETAIPVILATVLIALGWVMALPPTGFPTFADKGDLPQFWAFAFGVNDAPIIYAFLGAYFFSLQMLFRRYVREDLRKSAYLAVSLRIILAVIGTWAAIVAIRATGKISAHNPSLLVVGFVIGVFPRIAWQVIQGASKAVMRKLRISAVLPSMESRLPVSDLDGLTVWHEARLEEEDIENIPNMASAEIVDLMLSTRFPPDRIIDWVDQAILFTHLGPDQEQDKKAGSSRRDLLRLHGIRTATSLLEAYRQARSRDDASEVERILSKASRSHVRSLLDAIRTESNLALICAWRNIG
jgi:hypothetical protein